LNYVINTNIYVKDDQDHACGLAEWQVLLCFLFYFKFNKIVCLNMLKTSKRGLSSYCLRSSVGI